MIRRARTAALSLFTCVLVVDAAYTQPPGAGFKTFSPEESQRKTQEYLLDGLEPKLASRIRTVAASQSLGNSLGWTFDRISKLVDMSQQEVDAGNRLLRERYDHQAHALQVCRTALVAGESIVEKDIEAAIRAMRASEAKHEAGLNSALGEVLRPSCLDRLVSLLIEKNRFEFAEIGLVAEVLELSEKQKVAFSRANREFRQALFENLRSGKPNPGDLTKNPRIEKLLLQAENSLTPEQFQVYAQAVGILPKDKSLEEHYQRSDSRTREALEKRYRAFKTVARMLDERSVSPKGSSG